MSWLEDTMSQPMNINNSSSGSTKSTTTSTNDIDVKPTTNVIIDNDSIAEAFAQSQKNTSKTNEEIAKLNFINAQEERKLKNKFLSSIDTYLEHGKNGLIAVIIIGSLIYIYKKGK